MHGTPRIATWLLALVGAAATLAVLGLRELAADAERIEERLRSQSAVVARAATEAFESVARELAPNGIERIALSATADGEWPRERPKAEIEAGPTPFQRSQIDLLEREGDLAALREKLDEHAARTGAPGLAAWALSTRAAIEANAGDPALARTALERLVSDHPTVADERGLPRALVARWRLCQLGGLEPKALATLLRELIDERTALEPSALAVLAEDLFAALHERDEFAYAELRALDSQRNFARALRSTWRRGISNWLASGAAGGRAWFALEADPLALDAPPEYALLRATPSASGFDVVALRASALAKAALDRPELTPWRNLGFGASVVDAQGRCMAGPELELDADTFVERLPPPFEVYAVRARSLDIESARFEARTRFWTIAGVSALALLASAFAAWIGIRALDREARAAHQREQFVAAVTHELKAPLASIRLLAELLEQGGVSEAKVREFGARTVTEADRLSRLISSVLEMARLDRGGAPQPREEVLVRQLVLETLHQFEPLALEKHVAIKLHPCDESLRILASRDALGSALFELLTNATKYGGARDIEVEIEPRGASVVVAVLDRGPGVASGDCERIFEPFQRLGDELTREQPGVGLGLALVRKVAESHGGAARCVARDGGGSRFEIELPSASEASS